MTTGKINQVTCAQQRLTLWQKDTVQTHWHSQHAACTRETQRFIQCGKYCFCFQQSRVCHERQQLCLSDQQLLWSFDPRNASRTRRTENKVHPDTTLSCILILEAPLGARPAAPPNILFSETREDKKGRNKLFTHWVTMSSPPQHPDCNPDGKAQMTLLPGRTDHFYLFLSLPPREKKEKTHHWGKNFISNPTPGLKCAAIRMGSLK